MIIDNFNIIYIKEYKNNNYNKYYFIMKLQSIINNKLNK